MTPPIDILFLCTGNSARSILAEAIASRVGAGRLRAHSAGSSPKGTPHPAAIEILSERGYGTGFARSKSWDVFSGPDAPMLDMIITVCDQAAGESCPIWPGHPATAHWGMPDPAAVDGPGPEQRAVFAQTFDALHARISALAELPLCELGPDELREHLNALADLIPGGKNA